MGSNGNEKEKEQALAKAGTAVALKREDLIGAVTRRVQALTKGQELRVPENYAIGNAIAAWWLKLQQPIDAGSNKGKTPLELSTDESVIAATLDMVVLGLDPAKEQCYPIVYDGRCTCRPSYIGRVKTLKDIYPEARVFPQVVYEGDDFERAFENGRQVIRKHVPGENNGVDGKETGAYVVIELGEGHEPHVEYMPMQQIRKAWQQGGAGGNSPAHKGFPGEMAKKTVLARGCKVLTKASNHSYLVGVVERQDMLAAEAAIDAEVEAEANGEILEIPSQTTGGGQEEPQEAASEEPQAEDPAGQDEQPDDPTPRKRFEQMCETENLSPGQATELAAEWADKDKSAMRAPDYEAVLERRAEFVNAYRGREQGADPESGDAAAEEEAQQPAMAGPGF